MNGPDSMGLMPNEPKEPQNGLLIILAVLGVVAGLFWLFRDLIF